MIDDALPQWSQHWFVAVALAVAGSISTHGIHLYWSYRCQPWSGRLCFVYCVCSGSPTQKLILVGVVECEAFIKLLLFLLYDKVSKHTTENLLLSLLFSPTRYLCRIEYLRTEKELERAFTSMRQFCGEVFKSENIKQAQ